MEQQKLSFMVIDDSELDCFIARKFIEHTDKSLQTVTYLNAKLAIAQIRKDADNRNMPLTIILLDLRMPIMNGFQFVDQFEKLPMDITQKYRIYILSSSRNTNDIQQILGHATVHGMIEKPLTREKLTGLFNELNKITGS